MSVFVYADGALFAHADVEEAVDAALDLATRHVRVGIACTKHDAIGAAARALPGMVVCPRSETLADADCYPLTKTMSLVRRCNRSAPSRP